MATPFTPLTGTESVGATEHSLPSDSTTLTPQTTPCKLRGMIDARSMVPGDQYRIRVLEKVAGGTQAVAFEAFITGAQVEIYELPERWVNEGWDVTMKLMSGSASAVTWSLKQDVGDANALTIGANAITAAATAADFGTEVAAAVWATISEGSETVLHQLRMLVARLIGKATVQDGDGAYAFRDLADTKNRVVMSRAGTARTVTTRDGA
jgi:hypothetical protein